MVRDLLNRLFRKHTPTILQMEVAECGAVALGIVLGYHGCYVSRLELRERCAVSYRDGSDASNLAKAAEYYGMQVVPAMISGDDSIEEVVSSLKEFSFPYILYWSFNHFVVLENIVGDKVYINDPATGPRTITLQELNRSFTGLILHCVPGKKFEKKRYQDNLLTSIWQRIYRVKSALVYIILVGLALVVPGIAIPGFSKIFIDNILIKQMHDWLHPLVIVMAAIVILQTFILWLQHNFIMRLSLKLAAANTTSFFWHVLRLPITFFDSYFTGDINRRIDENNVVAKLLSSDVSLAVVSLVTCLFYGMVLLLINPVLTWVVFLFALSNLLLLVISSRVIEDNSRHLRREESKLFSVLANGLAIIETIKTQGLENSFFSNFTGAHTNAINVRQKAGRNLLYVEEGLALLSKSAHTTILVVGCIFIIQGDMSIGMYIAFVALMTVFLKPFKALATKVIKFKESRAIVERVDDVLVYGQDKRFVSSEQQVDLSSFAGKIELSNITFGYDKFSPPLIKNFSLSVKTGKRIAIVGRVGSGKSTIIKLISGLYWPWEGEILFDGEPFAAIPVEINKYLLSIVNQEISMFSGTVRDNLTVWNEDISDNELVKACKDACIYDELMDRPDGLLANVIEGGNNFSTGQKQRFEIARALVTNPKILLLDEATSSLDPITEAKIVKSLSKRGCTSITIAHRLSTVRDCDEIIVLDHGAVVEQGDHKTLLAKNGHYVQLVSSMYCKG